MSLTTSLLVLMSIVSLVSGDIGIGRAQWPVAKILEDANTWVADITAQLINSFQNGLVKRYDLDAGSVDMSCPACTGSMFANLTAKLRKYDYSAMTSATAIAALAKDLPPTSQKGTSNDGTGLVPVSCAVNQSLFHNGLNPASSFQCNLIVSNLTLDLQAGNMAYASSMPEYNIFKSPATLLRLAKSPRTLVQLDPSNISVMVHDELENLAMSMYVMSDNRVMSLPECKNATLVLQSLESQIVGGDTVDCSNWNDTVLVLKGTSPVTPLIGHLTSASCANALKPGVTSTTIVFPQQYDVDASRPFAYAILVKDGLVFCYYKMFQHKDPSAKNRSWAHLYAFGNNSLSISSCSPQQWLVFGIWSKTEHDLNYTMEPVKPEDVNELGNVPLYTNDNHESLNKDLLAAMSNASTATLGSGFDGDECVWQQRHSDSSVVGAGAPNFAKEVITVAAQLMNTSAKGTGYRGRVLEAISTIESQVGAFTLFNALTTGMASLAAAIGVNTFPVPFARIGSRTWLMFFICLAISLAEAAVVNLPVFTYMVLFARNGKMSASAKWSDSYFNNNQADYVNWSAFVGTRVTLSGQSDQYNVQWLVLSLALVFSTMFVMYRWHKSYATQRKNTHEDKQVELPLRSCEASDGYRRSISSDF